MTIKKIYAREILDSRGNPTIEVDLTTELGLFRSSVPSGASVGAYEALELRDTHSKRYHSKGVRKAIKNINNIIAPKILGLSSSNQKEIDTLLIELDGTKNKNKLGANAILAVSMATCRAGAAKKNIPLYEHIAHLANNNHLSLPVPAFNIINGGKHAGNKLAFQEFMILPKRARNFKEALKIGSETYHTLKKIIEKKYGLQSTCVGDEGGFAPDIFNPKTALDLLTKAITEAGYEKKVKIGIDVAASEFFNYVKYDLNFKDKTPKLYSGDQLIALYKKLVDKYEIFSLEDPFGQDSWINFSKLTSELGNDILIIGDDLLATNPSRIINAIQKKACNAIILKINQIGTITESINAYNIAKNAKWRIMVSHRSGETNDDFIADLAVGLGTGLIKAGAPARSERLSKYNRLLRIEEELLTKEIPPKYG